MTSAPAKYQLWFVDVVYRWPDIAHTDRYALVARTAKEAREIATREAAGQHTGWVTSKQPPKVAYKAYPVGVISLVGEARP